MVTLNSLNLSVFPVVSRAQIRTPCYFRFWHVQLQRDDTVAVAERFVCFAAPAAVLIVLSLHVPRGLSR